MPFRFLHPHAVPYETFDPAKHRVEGVSGNSILRGGVHAWVQLRGIYSADPNPTEHLARFRVPIRPLLPGPSLGERDPEVMAWIERWEWTKAVEACERRWIERRTDPQKWAAVQRQQAAFNREAVREAEARRREDAARPSLFDEMLDQTGIVARHIAEGVDKTVTSVGDVASGAATFIKWGAIGAAVIGGGLATARIIEAVRR